MLNSSAANIQFILKVLADSLASPRHFSTRYGYSTAELLTALGNLAAVADLNVVYLVENDLLTYVEHFLCPHMHNNSHQARYATLDNSTDLSQSVRVQGASHISSAVADKSSGVTDKSNTTKDKSSGVADKSSGVTDKENNAKQKSISVTEKENNRREKSNSPNQMQPAVGGECKPCIKLAELRTNAEASEGVLGRSSSLDCLVASGEEASLEEKQQATRCLWTMSFHELGRAALAKRPQLIAGVCTYVILYVTLSNKYSSVPRLQFFLKLRFLFSNNVS